MLGALGLKSKVTGKSATIVEYIICLTVAIIGIMERDAVYPRFEEIFGANNLSLPMAVLTMGLFLAAQAEFGQYIWESIRELIFMLGKDEKTLHKYFAVSVIYFEKYV